MNEALTDYFIHWGDELERVGNRPLMPDVEYNEIIDALNEHFGLGKWAWEVTKEMVFENYLMTTVALYVPGGVYTGRAYSNLGSYDIEIEEDPRDFFNDIEKDPRHFFNNILQNSAKSRESRENYIKGISENHLRALYDASLSFIDR